MTGAGTAERAADDPATALFRVVRGVPDAAELAALTVVLMTLRRQAGRAAGDAAGPRPAPERAGELLPAGAWRSRRTPEWLPRL